MKRIIAGIFVLAILTSCVERDEVVRENKKVKTNLKKTLNIEIVKKESDTIGSIPMFSPTGPSEPIEDPGQTDPGEVGPIVVTPPK